MNPVLRISDLSARYGQSLSGREVLRHVSLELETGDCLVVVGPNGSGKSTLLHAIAGTLEGQVTGDIELLGRKLLLESRHRRARRISLVHQDPGRGTAAHLSLKEHCRLTTTIPGRTPVGWPQVAAQFESLGTLLEPGRLAGDLSGGQRQLFTVLLAVLSAPHLLLLDEPTSALDARHQAMVLNVVDSYISAGGHATIVVTHDLGEAVRLGNRLLVMGARGEPVALLGPGEKKSLDKSGLKALLARATTAAWDAS